MTRITLVLAPAMVSASLAEAQSVSFDRLALLVNQGDRIMVTDIAGRELRGRIVDLSPSTLSLQTDGLRHDLNGGDISAIRRRERDSLKDGAVLGFLSGAAIAVGFLVQTEARNNSGLVLSFASLAGAAGTAIGVCLDGLHEGSQVIYSAGGSNRRLAVSPLLSRSRRGLSVSLGF